MTDQAIAPAHNETLDIGQSIEYLKQRFPEAVKDDTRQGYSGIVVARDQLVEVAQAIRDDLGFDYLSSATGVDYLGVEDSMEMVYHSYRTTGGPALVFKAQTERENARIPSLIDVWPGADFQEREAFDLYGIRFPGHPNLKRILLWDGFNGHPMRKDWHEAYYESDLKPFDSRWPKGYARRAEELNMFGKNVAYPDDLDLSKLNDTTEASLYSGMGLGVDVSNLSGPGELRTDRLVVNLGPHHPSTHGVLRLLLELDGEEIISCIPDVGYLHTGIEKNMESKTYEKALTLTDRMDYLAPMSNNTVFSMAVEKLGGIDVPERAQLIRVICLEMTRINSHLVWLGTHAMDLGAMSVFLYCMIAREKLLDMFEMLGGQRMMTSYIRPGGLWRDIVPEFVPALEAFVAWFPAEIDVYESLLTDNPIWLDRTVGIGVVEPEMALALGMSGPTLRASGVNWDVRKATPYSGYETFDFDVPLGEHGDVFDRYIIRMRELHQCVRILKQGLKRLTPAGEFRSNDRKFVPPPRAELGRSMEAVIHHFKLWTEGFSLPDEEVYVAIESPRGEIGCYLHGTGGSMARRVHFKTPSFLHISALSKIAPGYLIADLVGIVGSIDCVLGDSDR